MIPFKGLNMRISIITTHIEVNQGSTVCFGFMGLSREYGNILYRVKRDNGRENRSCYLGFRVWDAGFRV